MQVSFFSVLDIMYGVMEKHGRDSEKLNFGLAS